MIPYFLTFDHGLADLYDLYPQRSCVFGNEIEFPLFYAEMDLSALILDPYPELEPVLFRLFSVRAAEERDQRRIKRSCRATSIIPDLERRLSAFEAD